MPLWSSLPKRKWSGGGRGSCSDPLSINMIRIAYKRKWEFPPLPCYRTHRYRYCLHPEYRALDPEYHAQKHNDADHHQHTDLAPGNSFSRPVYLCDHRHATHISTHVVGLNLNLNRNRTRQMSRNNTFRFPSFRSTTHVASTTTPSPPVASVSPYPSFKVSRIAYQDGSIETMNLDTSELMKATSLYARDLFFTLNLTSRHERYRHGKVPYTADGTGTTDSDSAATATASSASMILPRRTVSVIQSRIKTNTILLSFGKLQAVTNLQYVYLLNAHNPAVRDFANHLSYLFQNPNDVELLPTTSLLGTLTSSTMGGGEPNELIFLECCLRDTVDSYFRRLRLFEPIVDSILEKVDQADVTSPDSVVYQLAPLKDALKSFEIQVRQSLECLENILNRDDEMLGLLLTEHDIARATGEAVDFSRHEHVELLLGVYARQISTIHSEVQYVLQRLQSKQEFVTLALSSHRNRMVQMNVHLGIAGLSLGFSTAVAGFFGMNLVSTWETSATAWMAVVLGSSLGSLFLSLLSLNHLSGEKMRLRAKQRLEEMETLTSALSDMCALDHTLKSSVERGAAISKDQFRTILNASRQSREASTHEVDLLFDVFDKIKDGTLTASDFQHYERKR